MLSNKQGICWVLVPMRDLTPISINWALCKGMHVSIQLTLRHIDVEVDLYSLCTDSVLDIKEVDDLHMIRLRNPWGADIVTLLSRVGLTRP